MSGVLITLAKHGGQLPPLPSPADMHHNKESLGWLLGTWAERVSVIMLLVGFGHSVLAMSGEESLAQINREIEHPKLKNLEKTGLVIFLYSLFFTSLVSFFAVMIIPDKVRPEYFANLISGLAMNVVGPYTLRLFFQGFRGDRGHPYACRARSIPPLWAPMACSTAWWKMASSLPGSKNRKSVMAPVFASSI